jgi:hypothetical protein
MSGMVGFESLFSQLKQSLPFTACAGGIYQWLDPPEILYRKIPHKTFTADMSGCFLKGFYQVKTPAMV